MFVGDENAVELLRRDAALLQAQHELARAQSAIDQNFAVIGRDQRAVSRAPAAEHGQAEHGLQVSRVTSAFANGIVIRTILSAMRVGDHDAVEYIRHGNAQSRVWREIAGLPRPRILGA